MLFKEETRATSASFSQILQNRRRFTPINPNTVQEGLLLRHVSSIWVETAWKNGTARTWLKFKGLRGDLKTRIVG